MALSQQPVNGGESGTNLTRVKDFNEAVVLDLVRSRGEITRPAIAETTGLTLQTVANITRRLLASRLVSEHGDRRRRLLRLDPDAATALGIQLDRPSLSVALVNLAGEIRARETIAIHADEPPELVVEHMAELARTVATGANPLGAGIGAPGPLDLRQGRLLGPLGFAGWDNFPLRERVAQALDLRVIMDNDATAAALGEHWRGAGGANFVYLYLGRGLGAGLIVDGQAFRGRLGNAGEISHIQVNPDGPHCDCGANGCLGLYATPDGLLREARRAVLEGAPHPYPESFEEIEDNVVITKAASYLANVVDELTQILDPELIILGGPLTPALGGPYAQAIRLRLAMRSRAPQVQLSRIGSDAGVTGAATLVLHDLYAPTPGKLSL